MIPQCKQNENDFKEVEQKYNSIKKFTDVKYTSNRQIKINSTVSVTFLVWVITSGGSQNPSLLLVDITTSGKATYVGEGGMHDEITYSNEALTITLKNNYAFYGYIKLR